MKYLSIICVIALFSCKKEQCQPTIKGRWCGENGLLSNVHIASDTITFPNLGAFPYKASSDTIFHVMDDNSLYAQYGYVVTCSTLVLYPVLNTGHTAYEYTR